MTVEANAVEATGALNVTLGTTDGTVQETTYEALAAVDGRAPMAGQSFDGMTLEFDDRSEQLWARQTAARQTTSDDDSYDAGYDMGTDTTAMLGAAGATRAAGGQDGQSLPDGAGGGTALGLGALAAAVVIRSTPLVAGAGGGAGVGAGTSAASSYLSTLLDRVKPFVFPLRYSRYDDSDPLEHDAREQVYGIVSETPGSYLSKVSERADLPLSTTRHHMKVLEREGLVSGAKLRGKRRFYPAYAEGIELAAALNDESTASIIDALARLGAASVSDLAEDLGRDPSTISHHLQRLEEDDIIAREREGRAVINKLSPEARTALDPEQTPKPEETAEAVAN
jgi:predicted transcriptional regulator